MRPADIMSSTSLSHPALLTIYFGTMAVISNAKLLGHLWLEAGHPSNFGSLLKSIGHFDKPRLVALQSTEADSKWHSLIVIPSWYSDRRHAADGENGGGVRVGCDNRIQLVLLHQFLQHISRYLFEYLEYSFLPGSNAIGFLGISKKALSKIFKPLLQRSVIRQ